jgi:SUMO ligase MMS21 Smc5/6 complex component
VYDNLTGDIQSYNFSIQKHIRHSENSLSKIVENTTISIKSSQDLIDNLLGNGNHQQDDDDDDDELVILQESVKVSLKCPITLKRIKMPVRGIKCKHIDVNIILLFIL